ncbi:hypothetical protein BgiBS90_038139 [Biomphalaria glabrata]|nr:hypothetical protein BgiBS90_038139 [Biomphalaria glabrata]
MGTAWHEIHTVSVGFSRADRSAPDTARAAVLYGAIVPISGQADSRDEAPYKEKRTLPGAPADVPHFVCVAARGPKGPISVSSLQSSRLNICYYHQDLHPGRLHQNRFPGFHAHPAALLLVSACLPDSIAETARYRSDALAPSIFRAG